MIFNNNQYKYFRSLNVISVGYIKEGDIYTKKEMLTIIKKLKAAKTLGLRGVYCVFNNFSDKTHKYGTTHVYYEIDNLLALFEHYKIFDKVKIVINPKNKAISMEHLVD